MAGFSSEQAALSIQHEKLYGLDINARHSLRQAAQNFVGHAFAQARQFYGVHALATDSADQDDFVSNRDTADVADVNDGQVHRNASDDRRVLTTYDHAGAIRQQSGITVRITYGQHGDAAARLGDEGAHVADRFSCRDFFQREHTRFP